MTKKTGKRVKHIPQRTCIGCRQVIAKRTLIRVVHTPQGVQVDLTGKANGRGAYLHDRRSCWERGLKGTLSQALRIQLTDEDQAALRSFLSTLPEEALEEDTPPSS